VAIRAHSARRRARPTRTAAAPPQRSMGPAAGPVIGGVLAGLVGLRRAFIATAMFYAAGLVVVYLMYDERATHAVQASADGGRVTFRSVLAFQNFILMMAAIFGLQFVDRSFGPVLPLWVERVGAAHTNVALVSGMLFSVMALTGALGHHFCGKLLVRHSSRVVIGGGAAIAAVGSALMSVAGAVAGLEPPAAIVAIMT